MKMFGIGTKERVSRVIRPWLCTFICDQLLNFGHDLEYDSLFMFVYFSLLW